VDLDLGTFLLVRVRDKIASDRERPCTATNKIASDRERLPTANGHAPIALDVSSQYILMDRSIDDSVRQKPAFPHGGAY